jgi:hypothetical protein
VEWSLSPHTNTYSEVKLPPEMDAALEQELDRFLSEEWNEDGTEMIDAHLCRRYVGRYREPGFKLAGEARTVCYIDTQTGLRRREYNYDAKGDLVATIDYSAGPPPRTVFELPAGCKRG